MNSISNVLPPIISPIASAREPCLTAAIATTNSGIDEEPAVNKPPTKDSGNLVCATIPIPASVIMNPAKATISAKMKNCSHNFLTDRLVL